MKFDLNKEIEEIAYLNGIAKAHIEEGERLNEKASILIIKTKALFDL